MDWIDQATLVDAIEDAELARLLLATGIASRDLETFAFSQADPDNPDTSIPGSLAATDIKFDMHIQLMEYLNRLIPVVQGQLPKSGRCNAI